MESKSCEDDIDALLSAAGTFVRDAKTTSSSVVGSHLAGCTSTQSMQGNVDVPLHGEELSMNVTSNVISNVDHHAVACNEPSSSYVSADNAGRSRAGKPVNYSADLVQSLVSFQCPAWGTLSDDARLTSVCLTSLCLTSVVAYIGPKSRTEA